MAAYYSTAWMLCISLSGQRDSCCFHLSQPLCGSLRQYSPEPTSLLLSFSIHPIPRTDRTASSSQDITQLFAFLKPSPLGRPDCAARHLRGRGVSTSLCLLTFLYCPDFTPHPTPLRLLAAKASVSRKNQGGGAFVSGCTDPLSAGGLVLTSLFHGAAQAAPKAGSSQACVSWVCFF